MKTVLTLLVVGIFGSIAIFGVLAMNHGHNHGGCLAATLAGSVCPENDAFSFLNFHLGAFKSFSTATFITGVLLFSVFLLALGGLAAIIKEQILSLFTAYTFANKSDKRFTVRKQFARWLAFHENSPNFL